MNGMAAGGFIAPVRQRPRGCTPDGDGGLSFAAPPLKARGKLLPAPPPPPLRAALIDWGLAAVFFFVFVWLPPRMDRATFMVSLTALLTLHIYQFSLIARTGQSLGKRWLRIEIVGTDGSPPGWLRGVLLRTLLWP